jgi:hypothetical protein
MAEMTEMELEGDGDGEGVGCTQMLINVPRRT